MEGFSAKNELRGVIPRATEDIFDCKLDQSHFFTVSSKILKLRDLQTLTF